MPQLAAVVGHFSWVLRFLFDPLVGAREQLRRHVEAACFRGLQIQYRFVLGRLPHRRVGRLLALKDVIDLACCVPVLVDCIGPTADQAAFVDGRADGVEGGQVVLGPSFALAFSRE